MNSINQSAYIHLVPDPEEITSSSHENPLLQSRACMRISLRFILSFSLLFNLLLFKVYYFLFQICDMYVKVKVEKKKLMVFIMN